MEPFQHIHLPFCGIFSFHNSLSVRVCVSDCVTVCLCIPTCLTWGLPAFLKMSLPVYPATSQSVSQSATVYLFHFYVSLTRSFHLLLPSALSLLPLLSLYGRLFLSVSSSLAYVVIPPIINDLIFADVNLRSSSDSSIDINGPPMGLQPYTVHTRYATRNRPYIHLRLFVCMHVCRGDHPPRQWSIPPILENLLDCEEKFRLPCDFTQKLSFHQPKFLMTSF